MKNAKTIIVLLVFFLFGSMWIQAQGNPRFLNNGFQALLYHSFRLEDSFPKINPLGLAIEEFEKAAREGSHRGEANLMMGLIYQYMNRPGTALGYYLDFANAHPEEVWVYSLIGDVYTEMGRLELAEKSYAEALQNAPEGEEFAQAYLGLGTIALEQGRHEQAKEAFEQALEYAGDLVDARIALGQAFYYLAEYEEAISILEKAQLQAPRSLTAYYYLALSYEATGQNEQAEHAFARIEELQNKN